MRSNHLFPISIDPEDYQRIFNAIKAVCSYDLVSISYKRKDCILKLHTETEKIESGEFSEASLTHHMLNGVKGWLKFQGIDNF